VIYSLKYQKKEILMIF